MGSFLDRLFASRDEGSGESSRRTEQAGAVEPARRATRATRGAGRGPASAPEGAPPKSKAGGRVAPSLQDVAGHAGSSDESPRATETSAALDPKRPSRGRLSSLKSPSDTPLGDDSPNGEMAEPEETAVEPAETARRGRKPSAADEPPRGGKRVLPSGERARLRGDVAILARTVEEALADLGAPGHVVAATVGPTITRLGVSPAIVESYALDGTLRKRERVRVSKIVARTNDLALALGARSLRLEAPVPGQSYIGIEIPNAAADSVTLSNLLADAEFKRLAEKAALPVGIGRDVAGRPVVADLARLPHLLVAGSTGSGKSVALNGLLAALLSRRTPAEMRVLVIDPKRVEFGWMAKVAHLLAPVVVDAEEAVEMLGKLESEMSRRYDLLAGAGVREIGAYNNGAAHPMPRLVLVVDELADLMMLASSDVERSICRLAQLGRAAGVHIVVATQRPSVDVVTGLIKANLPARLAFAVASQIDSRTILDGPGAELLLGRGDFLFQPPDAPKAVRGQGAYISDEDLDRLVKRIRRKRGQEDSYAELFADLKSAAQKEAEELLLKARDLALSHDKISANFLQRKLRIGGAKAKELIAILDDEGLLGGDEE